MTHPRAAVAVWRSVRGLPDFWRLLELRTASQFADGLFQAGLAGALLFNPERATRPLAIAGAFAVLFLPYSLLGPFAGALMDRWDRRLVLIASNVGRVVSVAIVGICLAFGARNVLVLCGALVVNGLARFVASGLSAALPHVVPREQVVTMNSIASAVGAAAAFLGANFMLVPRAIFGSGDRGAASIIFLVTVPVLLALLLSLRFPAHVLGPDDTRLAIHGSVVYAVITGWLHGLRTVLQRPTVAATLSGLAAHRMVFGINSLVVLLLVRTAMPPRSPRWAARCCSSPRRAPGRFWPTWSPRPRYAAGAATPRPTGHWRPRRPSRSPASVLRLWVLVACGFLLGSIGQVVKLCADTAIQVDVDDALRGHVFAVQDSLFWVAFIAAITVAAIVIPTNGHSPALVVAGAAVYLCGLAVHSVVGRAANR